jgi:hypothetical protein
VAQVVKDVVELTLAGSNADLNRGRCPKRGNGDAHFLVVRTACFNVRQQEYRVHYCDTTKQRHSACPERSEGAHGVTGGACE